MAKKATARRKAHVPDAGSNVVALRPQNAGLSHPLANRGASAQASFDSLTNLISGMGTDKDKATHTMFGYQIMEREQLNAAYRSDWIARKAIDIPADDATREWRDWQGEADQIETIEAEEKRLKVQKKIKTAMQWARLHGGAALIMGVDGQGTADAPLDWTKVKQGQLKFVHVVSRWDITFNGQLNEDLNSEFYGEPLMWTRTLANGGRLDIHPSRVIKFIGYENPDKTQKDVWGDSILQVIGDAVVGAGTTTNSIAQLVAEAKIDIVKIPGMSEKMASEVYQNNLKARFANAGMMKSLYNTLLVDAAEEWERLNQQFTGLPDILQLYLMIACAAVDVPSTRFLSQAPGGLLSTGDADLRNYYDKCSTMQKNDVSPTIEPLDNVLIMSALGNKPDELWYEWAPLWQLTPAESADIAVKKSQVMTADVNAALFPPGMLYQMRLNQLVEDGTYPGIDQIEEEFGDDIDERQAEEQEAEAERMMQELANANAANENDPNATNQNAGKQEGGQPQKLPPARKAANDAMASAMADRISGRTRSRLDDATSPPRSLYIHRDVVNQDEIKRWAKKQGFASSVDDMHVTIIYSKGAVDWLKAGRNWTGAEDADGSYTVKAGGPRVMQVFGQAVVLSFADSELAWRHMQIMRECEGATYDFDDYTPHVTITYKGLPDGKSVEQIEPYQGKIVFGPELFQEIKPGFNNETDIRES